MDAIVIGAGPGGAAAAITLAPHLPVTLLHRPVPRRRPGETHPPGAEAIFRQLGVWERVLELCTARQPGYWVMDARCSRLVPYGEDEQGPWMNLELEGPPLDILLRERAQEVGAHLVEVEAVELRRHRGRLQVHADGRTFDGFVIDASGRSRVLARALGLRTHQASPPLVARFGWVTGAPCHPPMPSFRSDGDGWTWIAPLGNNRWAWTRVDLQRRPRPARWCPPTLRGMPELSPPRGLDVRWSLVPECAGPDYMLVGDAAALLDPALGHGVLKAMMTGIMAGDTVRRLEHQSVAPAAAAAAHRRWVRNWFESDVDHLLGSYRAFAPAESWVHHSFLVDEV